MKIRYFFWNLIMVSCLGVSFLFSDDENTLPASQSREPWSAPPAVFQPGSEDYSPQPVTLHKQKLIDGKTLYSIGDPTDEEQELLEYVNRSRADAYAEAQRFKDILDNETDLDIAGSVHFWASRLIQEGTDEEKYQTFIDAMVDQFNDLTQTVQPLSFNSQLIEAARYHSNDMLVHAFQGHDSYDPDPEDEIDPDDPFDRMDNFGYTGGFAGRSENVAAFSDSIAAGHAGLDIDWGYSHTTFLHLDGMQYPAGHRSSIHEPLFTEVGIGIVEGTNTNPETNETVGPYIVTQDFGGANGPFITGVAFYDINGNNFYDVGEGIGGLTVDVDGSNFYAVTSQSGGYSVPVPGNNSYTVTFSGLGLSQTINNVTISNLENTKIDFIPGYSPVTLSDPGTVYSGRSNGLTVSGLDGSTGYRLKSASVVDSAWILDAENGNLGITVNTTVDYDLIDSTFSVSGSNSYHLLQPGFQNQDFTINQQVLILNNCSISFWKLFRHATPEQFAKLMISVDGGSKWNTIWSEAGPYANQGDPVDEVFTEIVVDLSSYSFEVVMLKFALELDGSSAFPQVGWDFGVYFDDVTLSNAYDLNSSLELDFPDNQSIVFTPDSVGSYIIQVAGININRVFPYTDAIIVQAVEAPADPISISMLNLMLNQSGHLEFTFHIDNGPPDSLILKSADNPGGPFTDTTISPADLGSGQYEFIYNPTGEDRNFFIIEGTGN